MCYRPLFFILPNTVYVCTHVCKEEEEAEKGMTTGWSLHVNGSDSKIERASGEKESEVVSKAPSPMDCVSVP